MDNNNKKYITRYVLVLALFAMLLLVRTETYAQSNKIEVTGNILSSEDNSSLPGVSILEKGTSNGVSTDFDGNYKINVANNGTLVFSFVGFETQEIAVSGNSTIDIVLAPSAEALDEVVVTALGIKRSEKSLGYSVAKVKSEEFTRVVNENILNSMSGKVAGVTINSTGVAGSSVSIIIRGATSLSTDNQPLFVVDGVPIASTVNNVGGVGNRNQVDYGNAISDIDPETIESVSILKGPSAAALYGTRAGNGVVLITTKKAKKGEGMRISFSSNTVFDIPYRFFDVDSRFSTGFFSFRPENVGSNILPNINASDGTGAGPENDKGYFAVQFDAPLDANGQPIPTEVRSYPDNIKNFLNDYAFTSINSATLSSSTEAVNYRLGFSNMTNRGLIPNSDLNRNSFSLSASSNLWDKLTISTDVNFNHSFADNRPAGDRGTNPLEVAYSQPWNVDIRKLRDYGTGNDIKRVSGNHENPYFVAYDVNNSFSRYRIYGNVKANYQISDEFSVMARFLLNKSDEVRETKIAPGYSREPNNGTYGITNRDFLETNAEIMATYAKDFNDFNLSASVGGNLLYQTGAAITNRAKNGAGLIVPNVYTVQNISAGSLIFSNTRSEKAINSVYAMANFSWKNLLYLDLTARNDWSSTLPADNRSYFYPSASLSFLLNEVVDINNVNMFKLRGGWAQVGNDTGPYNLINTYGDAGQWGDATRLAKPSGLLNPQLKPEQATSLEFGTDIKMFNNRLRFEATYYTVDNENQILGIPLAASTGFSRRTINAGLLQSSGWEVLLGGTPIKTENWTWNVDFNYTKNETVIKELNEGADFLQFWSAEKTKSIGYVKGYSDSSVDNGAVQDGVVGNLYGNAILRVKDENSPYFGYPILGTGLDAKWIVEDELTKMGNYNPNFILGMQTSLSYKRFTLSMTFDWRNGGQFVSGTWRRFTDGVINKDWLDQAINPGDLGGNPSPELKQWVLDNADQLLLADKLRPVGGPTPDFGGFAEGFSGVEVFDGFFAPGVFDNGDGTYTENLGEDGTVFLPWVVAYPWDVSNNNIFDADYIKLREISLSYRLPEKISNQIGMQNVNFSVYSRNIMIWTKSAKFGVDPEGAYKPSGSGFNQGIEFYNVNPWVIPIGFKVGFTF